MKDHVYGLLGCCAVVMLVFSLMLSFYSEIAQGAVQVNPWVTVPLLVIAVCLHLSTQNENVSPPEKQ